MQRAKGEHDGSEPPSVPMVSGPMSGVGMALRIGTELVAALIVGVGLGLLLDYWLGTAPWLLVVFFFLGAAAGVLNVYRTASGIGLGPGGVGPRRGAQEPDDAQDGGGPA